MSDQDRVTSPHRAPPGVALLRILLVLLAVLLVHWIDAFGPLYFVVLLVLAALMLAEQVRILPARLQPRGIATVDRLAVWIVLMVFAVIGYLHDANTWLPDGAFNRPVDVGLWKTELVLCIAVAAPLARWMRAVLLPRRHAGGGGEFAREFALYVNFSGIAIVLWTGQAGLSLTAVASVGTLAVLAELTLRASS